MWAAPRVQVALLQIRLQLPAKGEYRLCSVSFCGDSHNIADPDVVPWAIWNEATFLYPIFVLLFRRMVIVAVSDVFHRLSNGKRDDTPRDSSIEHTHPAQMST